MKTALIGGSFPYFWVVSGRFWVVRAKNDEQGIAPPPNIRDFFKMCITLAIMLEVY